MENGGFTKIVPCSYVQASLPSQLAARVALRTMSAGEWIETHGSGTLRKNKRIGFSWKAQYKEERTAYEFGWLFECVPASRVMWGIPITEGDCPAATEAGWHIERYMTMRFFEEDVFEAKYIKVEYPEGTTKEGIGMVVQQGHR
jgi:hypothetical protein